MKKTSDYFLGFDVGTGSVGWAVTDESYNLMHFKGKDLWGMRMFETAQTAEQRRIQRTSRRRLERRRKRLLLLQELFAEEITKVDPAFFQRLKESPFYAEDKHIVQRNSLFNDADFNDKTFHSLYPTVYHLIKALIEDKAAHDIRLLYLACHTIIKKRGHFLFEGDLDSDNRMDDAVKELFEYLREDMEIDFGSDIQAITRILKDNALSLSIKQSRLKETLNIDAKEVQKKAVISLITGGALELSNFFYREEFKDAEQKKIALSKDDFDSVEDKLGSLLNEDFELIRKAKAVYDSSILSAIIGDEQYLSDAKIKIYEKHKNDLALLKKTVKKYHPDSYVKLFKSETEKDNYCAYIGSCKKNGKKVAIEKKSDQEAFYSYLKKILTKKDIQDTEYKSILRDIELQGFLPKQTDKKNAHIPYQLREIELKKILEIQSAYFPFLEKKDVQGMRVRDKILSLLTFRIPYYIGPVNDAHKERFPDRCWVVKKENTKKEKISPWNFDNYIDEDKTAEAFITTRTNKCSYLIGEDVLPRHSLLYSEYTVLNEINNLKIHLHGNNILNIALKQKIYTGLFKKYKTVSKKSIEKFLITEGICSKNDAHDLVITGIDDLCTSSLNSYISLKNIIGEKIEEHSVRMMMEEIIRWLSIYDEGEGKKIIKEKIKQSYSDALTETEIKSILKLKFSGWGRLSKKVLEGIKCDFEGFSEKINIITALRETNYNLMELLSNKNAFGKEIDSLNAGFEDTKAEFSYKSLVKDLYLSPSVKRMLWQTLRVAGEIKKVLKIPPKKIFIEMARGEEAEKGRTQSRQSMIKNLYEECRKDAGKWENDVLTLFSKIEKEDNLKLRSDKLYLYYTQLGRCMYSGESINLETLLTSNVYDIDHIYPQSKIKDDSLTNRVLVKKDVNQNKEDKYPLSLEIQDKQRAFWMFLHSKGFINSEKLSRLTRKTPLSGDELADFIARQLVETRQATKEAGKVLKRLFPDTQIVYVKARDVSDFRQKFDLIKCRDINDFHHAHDAYLNIAVGNVYHTKFTSNPRNFIKESRAEDGDSSYNLNTLFEHDVSVNNRIAWKKNESIACIKKMLAKNTPLYVRHSFCQRGSLFDLTIMKKGKGQFSLKKEGALSSITKYGGYNKVAVSYYVLVEYREKDKIIKSLETVPLYLAADIEKNKDILFDHLNKVLNDKAFKILIPKIKVNTLVYINGFPCHITGKTGERFVVRNAVQFCCNQETTLFLKRILKFNNVKSVYERIKKPFYAYDDYTLRTYVKNEVYGKKAIAVISETEFFKNLDKKLMHLYDYFVDKHKNSIYRKRPNSAVLDVLENGRGRFISLTIEDKLKTIEEILRLFRTVNENCDLENIGGEKKSGKTTMGKNVSNLECCVIVYQSVTGIFERRVDVLAL